MQMTPIRFGAIHIISKDKVQEMKTAAMEAVRTSNAPKNYADTLATALNDKAVQHQEYYRLHQMKDGRRIVLTNSGTNDLTRFRKFLNKRIDHINNLHSPKKSRHESWDIDGWTDEFITRRSNKNGIRINFLETDAEKTK